MAKRWEVNDGTINVAFKGKRHHIPTPTHTHTATHVTHTYIHTHERIHKDTHIHTHVYTHTQKSFYCLREIKK